MVIGRRFYRQAGMGNCTTTANVNRSSKAGKSLRFPASIRFARSISSTAAAGFKLPALIGED